MTTHKQEFATRPVLIRQAIAAHQEWIEQTLNVPLSETVIIDELPNLSEVGIPKLLGAPERWKSGSRVARRLQPLVARAEIPPQYPPLLEITHGVGDDASFEYIPDDREAVWTGLSWRECPVALRLHVYDCTVIVMNVPYHAGPGSGGESTAQLLIARRESVSTLRRLFEDIYQRDGLLRIFSVGGRARRVLRLNWDDLVVGANISTLLRDDFEAFWERKDWFKERNLPFRRGYLLHGPPGNGKSSAVRALMTSRNLNAYTRALARRDVHSSLSPLLSTRSRRSNRALPRREPHTGPFSP